MDIDPNCSVQVVKMLVIGYVEGFLSRIIAYQDIPTDEAATTTITHEENLPRVL